MASKQQQQKEVYSIAHTARCKLQLAADRPDRNLRFILGHAFTLDKIRLRIAEIKEDVSSDEDEDEDPMATGERRVSFRGYSPRPPTPVDRKRSPPPDQLAHLESDSDEDDVEVDNEEDEGLSLQRFDSGSARPPQMVDDNGLSDEEQENDPKSPPPLSDEELNSITGGPGDEKLAGLYQHVAGCPCHGEKPPAAANVWEIPRKPGEEVLRRAVVQVAV